MFLTASELKTLTGYSRASAQIRWLRDNGWRFTVNGIGDPVVALAESNRKLIGGAMPAQKKTPNWDGLNDGSQTAA